MSVNAMSPPTPPSPWFSIPMRGNERERHVASYATVTVVFDPHEG